MGALAILLILGSTAAAAAAEPTEPSVSPPATGTVAPEVDAVEPQVALVPVADVWSTRHSISLEGVRAALTGRHGDFDAVHVAVADLAALGAQLGVVPAASVSTGTPRWVTRTVRGEPRILGLVPAGSVRPSVKALALDGASLFGTRRDRSLEDWPLLVDPAVVGATDAFDPGGLWTVIAGGDVMLDREVHRQAVILGKGPDYPWDGGIARITSRTCCTDYGGPMITARRVREPGAVRSLLGSADIAVVNHEGAAPVRHRYHRDGFVFTFDPALEAGLQRAGIDLVSLANNHIRNAGSRGVVETVEHVREAGMASVGAGRDLPAARRGACLALAEQDVCFLSYVGFDVARNRATATRPGAAPLRERLVRADVARLRRQGAEVVIVMPHWGLEYVERPTAAQRRMARIMVEAGADAVLGAHSHVVGTLELIDGVPVLYSMGNLLFDHPRFERTLEGILVELTFDGRRVVQIGLHPTVLVDRSQVNLLELDGDGRIVLRRMREAS